VMWEKAFFKSWLPATPATHFDTLQHTATHCITLQHMATHGNTRRHTATQCNSLQLTATHSDSLPHSCQSGGKCMIPIQIASHTLQRTATRCNTVWHIATHYNTRQHAVSQCNPRWHTSKWSGKRHLSNPDRKPARWHSDACARLYCVFHMYLDTTHSNVYDSFICVTWLLHMCGMILAYVWHSSFICVKWLLHQIFDLAECVIELPVFLLSCVNEGSGRTIERARERACIHVCIYVHLIV
jgi:hypothetical protein